MVLHVKCPFKTNFSEFANPLWCHCKLINCSVVLTCKVHPIYYSICVSAVNTISLNRFPPSTVPDPLLELTLACLTEIIFLCMVLKEQVARAAERVPSG